MNIAQSPPSPKPRGRGRRGAAALLLLLAAAALPLPAQQRAVFDIAREPVTEFGRDLSSRRIAIHGVTLGMSWGEARSILDRASIPYIFQKGSAPVVYVPPQNSSFYYVLNPSSYDVIEMGIIGPSELPVENQYLFDAQRWRLTTARVQFFGSEGEFIINEEGESYNFPFQGFVLKYLTPGSFRFVMVNPTNKPLLRDQPKIETAPPRVTEKRVEEKIIERVEEPPVDVLSVWIERFAHAREQFEARNYQIALDSFREITRRAPDALLKVRAAYWMGESYFQLGRYSQALKQFQSVIRETDIETLRSPARLMAEKCRRAMGRR